MGIVWGILIMFIIILMWAIEVDEVVTVVIITLGALIIWAIHVKQKLDEQEVAFVQHALSIQPEMSQAEVISLMGSGYKISYLAGGIEQLDWTFSRGGGMIYKLSEYVYLQDEPNVRRVSVKFQDGIVVEVEAFNMN